MKLPGLAREHGPAYRVVNVVDASVVLKWVLPEPDGSTARMLLFDAVVGERLLVAPSLLWYEVFNVIRYKPGLDADGMQACVEFLSGVPIITAAYSAATFLDVMALARERQLTVYDASYVALALDQHAPLVTADEKLRAACSDLRLVLSLDEFYRR